MKRVLFAIAWILIVVCSDWAQAQSPRGSMRYDNPALSSRDLNLQDLNLSEEQTTSIRRIKNAYVNRMVQKKTELAGKQIEFKQLVADPNTSEEAIRAKGREIESINGQIIRDMISYEVEIRRILTPEQLRLWCRSLENSSRYPVRHQ
ncbi:MAG: Spy/CpxP family protein refolding chaperone [Syntrophaceae bacterium]